jgi:hypothetical protein
MREQSEPMEVSVCVDPQGDAAVFLKRGAAGLPIGIDVARLAAGFAARGLRLLVVSSSIHRAPDIVRGWTRSAAVGSRSIADAVLSLVDARGPALAPAVV